MLRFRLDRTPSTVLVGQRHVREVDVALVLAVLTEEDPFVAVDPTVGESDPLIRLWSQAEGGTKRPLHVVAEHAE